MENVYYIEGAPYVPIPKIAEFGPYSYSRVRGLIHQKKIPKEKLLKICNLTFLKMDFLRTLHQMSEDPDKRKKQQFQIDRYYEGKKPVQAGDKTNQESLLLAK